MYSHLTLLFLFISSLLIAPLHAETVDKDAKALSRFISHLDKNNKLCQTIITTNQMDMNRLDTYDCIEKYFLDKDRIRLNPYDKNFLLKQLGKSTHFRKTEIVNKLYQQNYLYNIFQLDYSLLEVGASTERINYDIYQAFEKLDCKTLIKNRQLQFEKPETLLCLRDDVIHHFGDDFDKQLLLDNLKQLNKSSHPLKKLFFEDMLAWIYETVPFFRLDAISYLLSIGASVDKMQLGRLSINTEESEKRSILKVLLTSKQPKKIASKLFQAEHLFHYFNLDDKSPIFGLKGSSLLKMGATIPRLNLKIYQSYKKLNCPSVIKNKQLRFKKPETLLCLTTQVIDSSDKYSNDLLISILDPLKQSDSQLKTQYFDDLFHYIFINNILKRLVIIDYLFELGVIPKKGIYANNLDFEESSLVLKALARKTPLPQKKEVQKRGITIANVLLQNKLSNYYFNLSDENISQLTNLLKVGASSKRLNLSILQAYKKLDCQAIIKNRLIQFEKPETLLCLNEQVIELSDEYNNLLLIDILDQLNKSDSPLKKQYFEELLKVFFSSHSLIERLTVIEHILALGVSTEAIIASRDYVFNWRWSHEEKLIIIKILFSKTNPTSKKVIEIANKLFQRDYIYNLFNIGNSYAIKGHTLIYAGATTERLNLKIYQAYGKLDCNYIIANKKLDFNKPETLLCLNSEIIIEAYEGYSNQQLIDIVDQLNKSKHSLKKNYLSELLSFISSRVADKRYEVIKHMLDIGVSPEKIDKIEAANGLGDDKLCALRSNLYDFQYEYIKKHSLPAAKVNLGNMMSTSSCHRVVCNKVIIKMVNRNHELRKIGSPVKEMLAEFNLTGRDVELLKAFVTPENVNDREFHGGSTPLEMLVDTGINHSATDAMKMLIDMGADIYLQNKQGISVNDTINEIPYLDEIKQYADKVAFEKQGKK